MNVYRKFLKIDQNDLNQDITFNFNAETNKVVLVTKVDENVTGVLPIGQVKDPTAPDAEVTLKGSEGITIGNDNSININTDFIESFVANLGYIKNDSDTLYHADNLTIFIDGDNTFSVNSGWLNTFVEGQGFAKTADIPTKLSDLTDDKLSAYLTKDEFEEKNVEYKAGIGLSLNEESHTFDVTISNVSQLTNDANYATTGFVVDKIAELDEDTTYSAGNGITITGENNVIAVTVDATSEGFLTVGADGLKLAGVQDAIDTAVSGLASEQFVLDKIEELDKDTVYQAGSGLALDDETKTFSLTATIPTTVAELEDAANYALTATVDEISGKVDEISGTYAPLSTLPTRVGQLNNDKSFVTVADLEAVKFSILQQLANITTVVSIDNTSVGSATENLFVETSAVVSANTTFTGKNITVTELNNENSYTKFTSDGDVSISNLNSSGSLEKNSINGNGQVIVNTPGRVVITDSTLNQNGYNAIEIGLASTIEPPKSVLIDGITFGGNLSNNTISIYGTAEDAVITISNCNFVKCSNPVRISNRTNTHVTINLVNCTFGDWETASPAWGGIFCCQDYTSTTSEEAMANNLFGSDKVVINITNCNHKGTPITFDDMAEVADTGDENQLIYVYYDKAGSIKYADAPERFPTMNVINN